MATKPKDPGQINGLNQKQLNDPLTLIKKLTELKTGIKVEKTIIADLKKQEEQYLAEWKKQGKIASDAATYLVTHPNDTAKKAQYAEALRKRDLANGQRITAATKRVQAETEMSANQGLLKNYTDVASKAGITVAGSGSNNNDNNSTTGSDSPRTTWLYNAPMVKHAYFQGLGKNGSLTTQLSTLKGTTPQKFNDALNNAFVNPGTRGVIQMSADTASWLLKERKKKKTDAKGLQPYGFRFHYNPGSISLNYGQMTGQSPEVLMSGRDQYNPLLPLDGGSGIQFDIYLNRIEDMSYIQKDGTLKSANGFSISKVEDLYSENVPQSALVEIYRKGTMYDLEYLFRAVHGNDGTYTSILRGKTSDVGWLNGVAVEFHLGNNMRYLARINSVAVNHAIFNDRMVPTLTTVHISASRYFDLPTKSKTSATSTAFDWARDR